MTSILFILAFALLAFFALVSWFLEEALKLSLSAQEEIANRLTFCVLGELQDLGFEEA